MKQSTGRSKRKNFIILISIGAILIAVRFGFYWIVVERENYYASITDLIYNGELEEALARLKSPPVLLSEIESKPPLLIEATIERDPKLIAEALFMSSIGGKHIGDVTEGWSRMISGLSKKAESPQDKIDLLSLGRDVKTELYDYKQFEHISSIYWSGEAWINHIDSAFKFATGLRDKGGEAFNALSLMNTTPNKKILVCYEIDDLFEVSYYDTFYLPNEYRPDKIGDVEFIILVETSKKSGMDNFGDDCPYFSTPEISLVRLSDNTKTTEFTLDMQIEESDKTYFKLIPSGKSGVTEAMLVDFVDNGAGDFWQLAVQGNSSPRINKLMPQIVTALKEIEKLL